MYALNVVRDIKPKPFEINSAEKKRWFRGPFCMVSLCSGF